MSLRPPAPTTNHLPNKEEASRLHRAAIVPVCLGLAIVLALAGLSYFYKASEIHIYPFSTGDLAAIPGPGSEVGDYNPLWQYSPEMPPEGMMILHRDDQQLPTEPAELAIHPQGQRLTGIARSAGHLYEEIAIWKVDVPNPSEALAHYLNSAAENHFEPLARQTSHASSSTGVITRVLTRRQSASERGSQTTALPPGNDVLIIRIRPTEDGQVMVTLWYRHALNINRVPVMIP
jgi:hypothetical protein